MDASQKAREYFLSIYNCSQSVFKAIMENFDLAEKDMVHLAAGFGGGIGKRGLTCGCISGAVMAIGAIEKQKEQDQEKHLDASYDAAGEFVKRSKKEMGSTLCKELIGYDLSSDLELQAARDQGVFRDICPTFVKRTVNIVLRLYD